MQHVELVLYLLLFTFFVFVTLTLSYHDHRFNKLPNKYTIGLMTAGLLFNFMPIMLFNSMSILIKPSEAVTACIVGYVIPRVYHDLQRYRRGYAGIGLGDAKYMAAIGAWFGGLGLGVVVVGALLLTLLLYPHRKRKPFGVGLSICSIGAWFYLIQIG